MENLLPGHNEQMLKATKATPSGAGIFYARARTIVERESVRVYKMPYVDERKTSSRWLISALRSRQDEEVPGSAVRRGSRTPILVF